METFDIKGVEIFSKGNWNGDNFTTEDLNKIVCAFNDTKDGIRPFLKLGHDEKQEILQKDGLPAAGWIDRLYVVGDKLLADFSDIPKKIYDLILSKAYRKVSCEIFYNLTVNDRKYQYLLGAVALLGADTPGVMNLRDIMSWYKNKNYEGIKVYQNQALDLKTNLAENKKEIVMNKTENEIKLEFDLQKNEEQLKVKSAELEEIKKAQEKQKEELEALKQFKIEAEKEKAQLLLKAETARVEKFVADLCAEKLCTQSMKPFLSEILGAEKKEYSISENGTDKKYSKEDLLKEALKLFKAASEVNFDENSKDSKENKDKEKDIHEKAVKYSKDHNVTYGFALKAVMKEQK